MNTTNPVRRGKMIRANGIDLFYEEFGNECDPAVLLVMGNSAPGLVWPDAFCELIAAERFRVVRFDQRDTGLSTYIDFSRSPYTLDDLVRDAFGILDGIGVKQAHVVGLSQGGLLAYRMSLKMPQRLRSLVILMSSVDLRPEERRILGRTCQSWRTASSLGEVCSRGHRSECKSAARHERSGEPVRGKLPAGERDTFAV